MTDSEDLSRTLAQSAAAAAFLADVNRDDDVGFVLRSHLHIEHALVELLQHVLPEPSACEWSMVGYRAKVEIGAGLGLGEDVKTLLLKIGSLRNDFAHDLTVSISKERAVKMYNALSPRIQGIARGTYELRGSGRFKGPASLDPRELVEILIGVAWTAVKAKTIVMTVLSGQAR